MPIGDQGGDWPPPKRPGIPIPCPIPRCALEWFLAALAAVTGTSVWLSGDPRFGHYDICLPFVHIGMSSMRWGVCLWLIAVAQAVSLLIVPHKPQQLVAGLAAFAWAAFSLSVWHGGMVAVAFGVACLSALGQLYVCAMLRGARWTG